MSYRIVRSHPILNRCLWFIRQIHVQYFTIAFWKADIILKIHAVCHGLWILVNVMYAAIVLTDIFLSSLHDWYTKQTYEKDSYSVLWFSGIHYMMSIHGKAYEKDVRHCSLIGILWSSLHDGIQSILMKKMSYHVLWFSGVHYMMGIQSRHRKRMSDIVLWLAFSWARTSWSLLLSEAAGISSVSLTVDIFVSVVMVPSEPHLRRSHFKQEKQ